MRLTNVALAAALISVLTGCADLENTQANTPESMCARLGGRVDVDGKWVGSVATGGRMYKCFDPNDPSFLVRRRSEQARVAQAREQESARAAQAQAEAATRAARAREVSAALAAALNCAAEIRPSLCANDDATKARACLDACIAAVDQSQQSAATDAESSCENRLSEGKGPLTCGLVTLPHAFKNAFKNSGPDTLLLFGRTLLLVDDFDTFMKGGDSTLGEFLNKLGAGTAKKLRDEMRDGKGPWDGVTLDAVFAQWITSVLQGREAVCTATCNERGRASKDAPGLVHAYKLCMVAADSTPEARRLQAFENTLYRDFLEHADSKCRARSRCDWLESFSTARCTYDSP
jgi:hypothetical protein